MFGEAPEKVKNVNVKEVVWDYWEPAKKKLLNADLLKRCLKYEKDSIKPEIVEKLRPIITSDLYSDEALK
jgi:hypothetical protein